MKQFLVSVKYLCKEWSKAALHAADVGSRELEISTKMLFEASMMENVAILRAVLDAFPALDMMQPNSRGCTIVHFAARFGRLGILQFCLERCSDKVSPILKKRGQYGYTPLLSAVRGGQSEAIKFLVDRGADIQVKDSSGGNALHVVAKYKQFRLIPLLCGLGVSVGYGRPLGAATPIDLAVQMSSVAVLRSLFECGWPVSIEVLAAEWRSHVRIAVDRRYSAMYTFLATINGNYAMLQNESVQPVLERFFATPWNYHACCGELLFLELQLGGE